MLARASISSAVATLGDGVAYQAVLFATPRYVLAALVGAFVGAVTNFGLNRYWSFPPTSRGIGRQALLYAGASALTWFGLQACLQAMVEWMGINPRLAWVPAKTLVWAAISYPLHRFVVFAGRPVPRH